MLAGTLHDLGKLVLVKYIPDRYAEVLRAAQEKRSPIAEVEQEMLETTHAAVGGYLADWWNLPEQIVEAIRWHSHPSMGRDNRQLTFLVHLSNVLVYRLEIGSSNTGKIPELDPSTSDVLGMGPCELDAIEAELEEKEIKEAVSSF